jgi:cobalt-zinc-cadmium efflux system protein
MAEHPHAHAHAHAHSHDHGDPHAHARQHDHAHDHSHSHDSQSTKILAIAFVLTFGFMLVETDAAALALAWTASRIAGRRADARRSFGYQRTRVIATFVNGCGLLFIVAWIAVEAVQRLLDPQPVAAATVLWIGALGFATNLLVFALLRRGHEHDMNIAAATLHVIGDLLGSVAAIIAAIVILLTGWSYADPISSLVVSALVVRSAWALVRRSTHILMEGTPDGLDVDELRSTLEQQIPAIRDVHHVHLWLIGPHEPLMTMHATIVPGANHAMVLRETKAVLQERFGITHATIQIEVEDCADVNCA